MLYIAMVPSLAKFAVTMCTSLVSSFGPGFPNLNSGLQSFVHLTWLYLCPLAFISGLDIVILLITYPSFEFVGRLLAYPSLVVNSKYLVVLIFWNFLNCNYIRLAFT